MNDNAENSSDLTAPDDIAGLLTYSLSMEEEAVLRYTELSDLMDVHNNQEIATLFKKMANIEKKHVHHIRELLSDYGITELSTRQYHWLLPEGPETADPGDLHYLMTPRQALTLALYNEQRAHDFYHDIVNSTPDEEVRNVAGALAEEEQEHVNLIKDWMKDYPENEEGWDYDDDPPILQD